MWMALFSPCVKPGTATRLRFLIASVILPICHCNQDDGTLFNVTAVLTETTCGSGVVNDDDSRDFQVRLTLDDKTLTWYDVESASSSEGTLNEERFSVSDGNTYGLTDASGGSVGCSVRRHDRYAGDATMTDDGEIERLEGTIVFKYSEATGYNCDALIGTSDGFEDLPCNVEYEFIAVPD